jgi:hypothetical protein
MTVIARDFLRHFSRYKRQAQAGRDVTVMDRKGQRYVFRAEKPKKLAGAGRRYFKGMLLSPEPVPESEWKGLK